jgi:hypothetical protein
MRQIVVVGGTRQLRQKRSVVGAVRFEPSKPRGVRLRRHANQNSGGEPYDRNVEVPGHSGCSMSSALPPRFPQEGHVEFELLSRRLRRGHLAR